MTTWPTNMRRLVIAATVALSLAACSSANGDATSNRAGGGDGDAGSSAVLEIADFAFADLTVSPGATVEVTNSDEVSHTVTSADEAFDSGTVDGGTDGSFVVPDESGTYDFACTIHPQMQGSITVA